MDERQLKSMGELAAMMYEDGEWSPPPGLSIKQAIDKWTEERFPGVHARVAAKKTGEQTSAILDAKIKEFDKKVENEHAARSRADAIAAIKANPDLRIRDEEIPEIEKLMGERYIGKYEDAAYRYRQINQVAAPRATNYSMEVPGLDGAGGDETGWLKPAFSNLGDKGVLDRVTKRRVEQIRQDFAAGRGARWE